MSKMRQFIRLLKYTGLTLAVLLVISLLWFILLSWPLPNAPGPASTAPLLLDNVSIVVVETGQINARQAVWIDVGRISKITPSDALATDGAAAIRTELMEGGRLKVHAAGRLLLPGLADMHIHSLQVSPQLTHIAIALLFDNREAEVESSDYACMTFGTHRFFG